MLIDEVIYNKVLYYPDSNSKLKVIKGKVSTKNIILSYQNVLTCVSNVEGYFHCTRYRVSRQYRRHGQIRILNQTRPKISLCVLQH